MTNESSIAPRFWSVIADADRDESKLRAQLMVMSRDELIRFYRDYTELSWVLREPPYIAPGNSEDSAEDLAWWIVSQGEAVYQSVIDNPALMPRTLPKQRPGLGFITQIVNVFFLRFDEEIAEVDLRTV